MQCSYCGRPANFTGIAMWRTFRNSSALVDVYQCSNPWHDCYRSGLVEMPSALMLGGWMTGDEPEAFQWAQVTAKLHNSEG